MKGRSCVASDAKRSHVYISTQRMQLVFDESSSTVWMFATSNELLEMAAIAQQQVTEAQLGESLAICEKNINRSNFIFRISAAKHP